MSSEVIKNEKTETKKYKTWLMKSILVTVFCNRILGLIGVIYAVKARQSYKNREMDKFMHFSLKTRKWTLLGFMLSILLILFIAISSFAYSFTTAAYIIEDAGNPLEVTWLLFVLSLLANIVFFVIKLLKIGRLLEKGQENQATEERQKTKRVCSWWFVGTIVAYVCFHWGLCN